MTGNVVLIAGQLLTRELWSPQTTILGAFEPMFADHTADDSIQAMASEVIARAPSRFSLVGHAMGGFVAFEILRQAPERVDRLVLMSTLAPADTPVQTARREGYLRLVEAGEFAKIVDERIPILLHPSRQSDSQLTGQVRKMAEDTGPDAFLRQQRAIMSRPDSRPRLGAIACPTLILWGRQDGIVTMAHQEEMRAAIPDGRLEIIEDCGHLMTLEQPDAVNAALRAWL